MCAGYLYLAGSLLVRTDQQTHFWSGQTIFGSQKWSPRTGFGTGPVLVPDKIFCDRPSLVVIILQNGTEYSENTNSYIYIYIYKSSLQRLISMSYISYMLVLILLELELSPSCLRIQFFLDTRIPATRVPACRTQHWRALSRCMQLMKIKHFSEDVLSCSVFS